jgi:hypothetical protein
VEFALEDGKQGQTLRKHLEELLANHS